jgi:hypothetical protein
MEHIRFNNWPNGIDILLCVSKSGLYTDKFNPLIMIVVDWLPGITDLDYITCAKAQGCMP